MIIAEIDDELELLDKGINNDENDNDDDNGDGNDANGGENNEEMNAEEDVVMAAVVQNKPTITLNEAEYKLK